MPRGLPAPAPGLSFLPGPLTLSLNIWEMLSYPSQVNPSCHQLLLGNRPHIPVWYKDLSSSGRKTRLGEMLDWRKGRGPANFGRQHISAEKIAMQRPELEVNLVRWFPVCLLRSKRAGLLGAGWAYSSLNFVPPPVLAIHDQSLPYFWARILNIFEIIYRGKAEPAVHLLSDNIKMNSTVVSIMRVINSI